MGNSYVNIYNKKVDAVKLPHPSGFEYAWTYECREVREPKKNLDTFCKILCPRNTNNHCYAVNNGLSASSQNFSEN